MRPCCDRSVSHGDGSSARTLHCSELGSPVQTPIPSANQATETERIEIAGPATHLTPEKATAGGATDERTDS